MTTIDHLGIQGIRSYGPDDESCIKFHKPLTIILGRNGSGKSTIIESVRMATTGELPPLVGKGAGFIHDPRIDSETETKARIRLLFSTITGYQYIISRNYQLTIKRGPHGIGHKTEFKTLNQTLKRKGRSGQDDDKSAKQEDINDQLPVLLRVTKPVLNNVIFVHQEESLWPLSDPKSVKEKFDEIFAATRYTKAMDSLRKAKTEQSYDLKDIKTNLFHYSEKVERLQEIQKQVNEIRDEHDQLKAGVNALDADISTLEEEKREASEIAKEYNRVENDLAQKEITEKHLESERGNKFAEMTLHCPELDDAALRLEIKRLQDMSEKADAERAERLRLVQSLTSEIEMKRSECAHRLSKKGMLEQLATEQRNRITNLDHLKDHVISEEIYSKPLFEGVAATPLPDKGDDNEEWSNLLKLKHREASRYKKHISEMQNKEIDKALEDRRNAQVNLQTAKHELERNTAEARNAKVRLGEIKRELRNSERVQRNLKDSETRQRIAQTQLDEKKNSNRIQTLEKGIAEKRKEVVTSTEEIRQLRRVREDLVQDQSERARYDMCRETLETKKQTFLAKIEDFVDTLLSCLDDFDTEIMEDPEAMSSFRDEITRIKGEPNLEDGENWRALVNVGEEIISKKDKLVEQAVQKFHSSNNALNSAKVMKKDLSKQMAGIKRDLNAIEAELNQATEELSGVHCRDVDIENIVNMLNRAKISQQKEVDDDETPSKVIEKTLKDIEDKTVLANTQVAQLKSGEELAIADLAAFKNDPEHKCPACKLSHPNKITDMEKSLKSRIELFKDPKNLKRAEKRVTRLVSVATALKKLQAHNSSKVYTKKNLDGVVEKLSTVEQDLTQQNHTHSSAANLRNEVEERFGGGSSVASISIKSVELNQLYHDLESINNELKNIMTNLSTITQEDRTLGDVDREMGTKEENLHRLQEDIERDRTAAQREREDLQRAENRLSNAKQKYLEEKLQAENVSKLKEESEQVEALLQETKQKIDNLTNQMRNLEGLEKDTEVGVARAREESELANREISEILSHREGMLRKWTECLSKIDTYVRSRKQEKLEELKEFIEQTEAEIKLKTEDRKSHEKEQRNAADSQADMQSKIRNYKDNQRYRIIEDELKSNARNLRYLREKLCELKEKAGEIPEEKVSRLTTALNEKRAKKHATLGKQQAKTEQYKEKRAELTKAEQQGSREKYDELRIQKQTMELASGDVDKYRRALDEALMAYHTLKMESINRTIRELWHHTYRGNDIDEIEIVSDHGVARGGVSDLKRSFNYRVQMRRGQATLDMRGRCSAGQKVLACLVIRLALAESFCTECGILALDEPTTNLDRENIESLGTALRAIIENRKHQKNFQLILITHDQEFIELIGAREFCSSYYTIYKDPSGLSKTAITDLQEMI